MAQLTNQQLLEVRADVMREFSRARHEIPITKPELTALLDLIDSEQEAAEASILAAIPVGPARNWLVAKQAQARTLIVRIEQKRAEVL